MPNPDFTPPKHHDLVAAMKYVRRRWDLIASFAWSAYQKEGRGYVSFDFVTSHWADGERLAKLWYVSHSDMPETSSADAVIGIDIADAVETYDPTREVIVMIARPYDSIDEQTDALGTHSRESTPEELEDLALSLMVRLETGRAGIDPAPAEQDLPPVLMAGVYGFSPPPPEAVGP